MSLLMGASNRTLRRFNVFVLAGIDQLLEDIQRALLRLTILVRAVERMDHARPVVFSRAFRRSSRLIVPQFSDEAKSALLGAGADYGKMGRSAAQPRNPLPCREEHS